MCIRDRYGCSYEPVVGLTLDEIGISVTDDMLPDDEDSFTGIRRINGFRNRCVFRRSGEYVIGVIYRMDVNSRSNMAIMVIMALYLCFAAGLEMCIRDRYTEISKPLPC